MIRLAVDLLWVRPKKVGGIESYIRNLLDVMSCLEDEYEFWLLTSRDNAETFTKYTLDGRFHLYVCDVNSNNVKKRIIWQNLNLGNEIKKLNLNTCFEPYYCKPFLGTKGIDFITTIHDLQALHYPEYFSRFKVTWMKNSWKNAVKTSKQIIAISNFVNEDICSTFNVEKNKVCTIYNPVVVDFNEIDTIEFVQNKYDTKAGEFYFTVSSLLPHKNIGTLIEVFAKIKENNINLPCKLIVSGVGGKSRKELEILIKEKNLTGCIQLTDYIENHERNALYKYCKAFLFPSVFEGFGMPPIEAMSMGTPVITTRKTCLEEVTQGKAIYVEDPFCADEWIKKMRLTEKDGKAINFDCFDKKNIAKQYLHIFESVTK